MSKKQIMEDFDFTEEEIEKMLGINPLIGIQNDVLKLHCMSRDINTPAFIDGQRLIGGKFGQVKGCVNKQIAILNLCKKVRKNIKTLASFVEQLDREVEDVTLGIVNSFQTEYDCDIMQRAWAYQTKFIYKINRWETAGATEDMKEDYDKCVALFKKMTAGLETHNFAISYFHDGSEADFNFTVAGVPGDFEINMPLNSDKYTVREVYLDSPNSLPMQIGLTWRRRWVIPVADYFFDDFGTFSIDDINGKLHEFINSKKYLDWCNTDNYVKEDFDYTLMKNVKNVVEYDEETKKSLKKALADEIEANGKEGKKFI